MKKAMSVRFALPVILVLSLSGCWDKVELESRSFVISLGIDKAGEEEGKEEKKQQKKSAGDEKTDRFTVSVAIPNPSALSGKGDEKSETVKDANGETILSAIHSLNSFSSNVLYFGQTKLAVLGRETLSSPELLREAIDTLERRSDFSRKLIVLSAPDEAKEVLEAEIEGGPLIGMYVSNFYKNNSGSTAISFKLDLETLIRGLRTDGFGIIPMISVEDKALKLGGASVIKDFELIGTLDDAQTRGYLYVKQKARGAQIAAEFEDTHASLRIYKISTKISFPEDEVCDINVKIMGAVEEYAFSENETLTESKRLELAKKYEETITQEILETSRKFQHELATDGFGLKDELRKKHNAIYVRHEAEWDSYFERLEINPNVNVEITGTGSLK